MPRADPRPLHILHIGKTGGNALAHALLPHAAELGATFHDHDFTLRDVPAGECAIFLVRHPVPRFVSGFNSRLRKGWPRHVVEWSQAEERAFSQFPTANALAERLASGDAALRSAAALAIGAIYHPARKLAFWLDSPEYLLERRGDILFIGATEHLDADFAVLRRVLGLDPGLALPANSVIRHATPPGFDTRLSAVAERAVTDWYREDASLYQACLSMRQTILDSAAQGA